MNRRQFLGALGAGATVSLAGCSSRYPLYSLHGLLPLDADYTTIKSELIDNGIPAKNIYINNLIGSIQIMGGKSELEQLSNSLPLDSYKIYPRVERGIGTQSSDKIEPVSELELIKELSTRSSGDNTKVGMVDTFADWESWYSQQNNHKIISETMNPILGRVFGDKDHGQLTAKTLFHQDSIVSTETLQIRGLIPNATAYHTEISPILTHPQLFRNISDSLQWMEENNVEIITMPLLTREEDYEIIPKILERFVEHISTSVIIVSAGNVDICEGRVNSLANVQSDWVIGVGAVNLQSGSIQGQKDAIDILAPSGYIVSDSIQYSGTSASSTLLTGILSHYLSLAKEEYPGHSSTEYRSAIISGLFNGSIEFNIDQCGENVFKQVSPIQGLTHTLQYIEQNF